MSAKLLAAVRLPPRFVWGTQEAVRPNWSKQEIKRRKTHASSRGAAAGASVVHTGCGPRPTPFSAVIVVIVPADLHRNKAETVFARNLFYRETVTCAYWRATIGQKAAASAGLQRRSVIGANACHLVYRAQSCRFEDPFKLHG